MIVLKNINKCQRETSVINNLSLEVYDKEIHGLIGSSGAGKSTILRMINGLESVDSGEVIVDKKNVSQLNDKQIRLLRKDIGMIFQDFALLDRKTVYDNVAFPLKCWGYERDQIDNKVRQLLNIVGLTEKKNELPRRLSGGQQQRVGIARSLALEPKVLLSDEATSGLDPNSTMTIINLLKKINEELKITIIVVSHEMEVIKRLCDRVSILNNGRIEASGKVQDLLLSFNPNLEFFLPREILKPQSSNNKIFEIVHYFSNENSSNIIEILNKIPNLNIREAKIEKIKNGSLENYFVEINQVNQMQLIDSIESIDSLNYRIVDGEQNGN